MNVSLLIEMTAILISVGFFGWISSMIAKNAVYRKNCQKDRKSGA